MSSQVPLWVTIAVALVGFSGVLCAQLIAAWREDRRWRREQEREELRWNRERTRELENRDYENRRDAYAKVVSALEAFDWMIFPALKDLRNGKRAAGEHTTVLQQAREEIRQAVGPIQLLAPLSIAALVRDAALPRSNLAMHLMTDNPDRERGEQLWREGQDGYEHLRARMRADLGLDAEDNRPAVDR